MNTVKQELIYCACNDYPLDTIQLGYIALNRNGSKGRLIGIIDAISQISSVIIGLPVSLLVSGIYFVQGIQKTCFHVELPQSKSHLFGTALFTPIVGIPVSLVWKVVVVAGDLLGVICPEIGRKTRLYNLVFRAAIQIYLDGYNEAGGFIKNETNTRYTYSYIPLATEIAYVFTQLARKNNFCGIIREIGNIYRVVNAFYKQEIDQTVDNPDEVLKFEFTASWSGFKPLEIN